MLPWEAFCSPLAHPSSLKLLWLPRETQGLPRLLYRRRGGGLEEEIMASQWRTSGERPLLLLEGPWCFPVSPSFLPPEKQTASPRLGGSTGSLRTRSLLPLLLDSTLMGSLLLD